MTRLNLFYAALIFMITLAFPNFASARTGYEGSKCRASDRDPVKCMVCAIQSEDNKSHSGGVAVGQVIMTRVKSGLYPASICAVIYQPGQFVSVRKTTIYSDSARVAKMVAAAKAAIAKGPNGFMGFRSYCRRGDKKMGGNCFRRRADAPLTSDIAANKSPSEVVDIGEMLFGMPSEPNERVQEASLLLSPAAVSK